MMANGQFAGNVMVLANSVRPSYTPHAISFCCATAPVILTGDALTERSTFSCSKTPKSITKPLKKRVTF